MDAISITYWRLILKQLSISRILSCWQIFFTIKIKIRILFFVNSCMQWTILRETKKLICKLNDTLLAHCKLLLDDGGIHSISKILVMNKRQNIEPNVSHAINIINSRMLLGHHNIETVHIILWYIESSPSNGILYSSHGHLWFMIYSDWIGSFLLKIDYITIYLRISIPFIRRNFVFNTLE